MVIDRFNRGIDDIYHFYNGSGSLFRDIWNHRFLFCAKACNAVWRPAVVGSIVLGAIGDKEYENVIPTLLSLALPTFILGHITFGAFWSKLGYEKVLADSWRESKTETVKRVLTGIPRGNVSNYYYQYKVVSEFYNEFSFRAIKKMEEKAPALVRGLEFVANVAYRAGL